MMTSTRKNRARRFAAATAAAALAVLATVVAPVSAVPTESASAASFARLGGDGSSFAAPAIDQWSTDVVKRGITIDYSPDGSAAGRSNYIQGQNDFAGSDTQFLTTPDPFGGGIENSSVAFSYIPIVAGGTAFMYNLVVGGKRITDLRLSGKTIADIFTGKVTNWSSPEITRDYGAQLPSQPITVITRSDGSGASYQFTRYLSKTYPAIWTAFCQANGARGNCGPTEFYPGFSGSQQKNGSDQVANYVASTSYGEGSIAYDEYSYAKTRGIPVVKVLNAAGYYTLPTASNVAVALQAAIINENIKDVNFLIQNLDNVYTYRDARTYPVSSYSYLIVPRDQRPNTNGPPPAFSAAKGLTLSTWLNYVLCGAQKTAGQLGYSPLPKNLVVGGFQQVLHIPGHTGVPDLNKLSGCDNPTYSDGVNHLIVDAPQPSPCDKAGSPLVCVVHRGRAQPNGPQVAGNGTSSPGQQTDANQNNGPTQSNPTGGQSAHSGNSPGSGSQGSVSAQPTAAATSAAPIVKIDPVTGKTTTANAAPGGPTSSNGPAQAGPAQVVAAQPVNVADQSGGKVLFSVLTALELLAALIAPAVLGIWLQRRRRSGS